MEHAVDECFENNELFAENVENLRWRLKVLEWQKQPIVYLCKLIEPLLREMPTEQVIRKKALEILKQEGWLCDFKPKTRFQHTDLFNVYDLVCVKQPNKVKFIQYSTLSNLSTRKRKVIKFLNDNKLKLPSEIWGWSKKTKTFKIVKV